MEWLDCLIISVGIKADDVLINIVIMGNMDNDRQTLWN